MTKLAGVALLFGVPTCEAEFMRRASKSDFLRKFNPPDHEQDSTEILERAWEREYRPWTAEPFTNTLTAAAKLGVAVFQGATLSSLQVATENHSTVILFSHWKGPEISNDDFLKPVNWELFRRRLDFQDSILDRWLLKQFAANGIGEDARPANLWEKIGSSWSGRRKASLREILDDLLSAKIDDAGNPSDGIDTIVETDATREARRRDHLDTRFSGLLSPGNRLELFDGLHSKHEVEAVIAPAFDGVLDLTTCTSTVLADFISNRRKARLRTVQFPTVQEPIWASLQVSRTLQMVADLDMPYLDARLRARSELEQEIRLAVQERK